MTQLPLAWAAAAALLLATMPVLRPWPKLPASGGDAAVTAAMLHGLMIP
jgi:hypothetical protein